MHRQNGAPNRLCFKYRHKNDIKPTYVFSDKKSPCNRNEYSFYRSNLMGPVKIRFIFYNDIDFHIFTHMKKHRVQKISDCLISNYVPEFISFSFFIIFGIVPER